MGVPGGWYAGIFIVLGIFLRANLEKNAVDVAAMNS
jgi:hypothetical protein